MVEGEEWDPGGRSLLHEIQPRPPRPRNNTRWVPLTQPATPSPPLCRPNALFFPLPPKLVSPSSTNGNKADKCPGFNHVFSSLKLFLTVCVQFFVCLCVYKEKNSSENDAEGIAVLCMYVSIFFFPPVSSVLFPCLYVKMGYSTHP